MTEYKAYGYNISYPQVGFRCFFDMKLVFEKQCFVGSSSVKSRSAYSLFNKGDKLSANNHRIDKKIKEKTR
jgi:hypothetical protein